MNTKMNATKICYVLVKPLKMIFFSNFSDISKKWGRRNANAHHSNITHLTILNGVSNFPSICVVYAMKKITEKSWPALRNHGLNGKKYASINILNDLPRP